MSESIALVHPKSTFLTDPMIWPPLGLWYLAAQLEAQGHEVEFYDLNMSELPNDGKHSQLWLSATSAQMYEVRKISTKTKKWEITKIVFGGSAVWADPQSASGLFDVKVVGEGDHPDTIRDVLTLENTFNDAIYYHSKVSKSLDWVLPPIRRWSLDYHAYMSDQDGNEYRMASLFTTRGCPFNCAFCESGRNGVIWNKYVRYEPFWCIEHQIKECKELGFTGLAYYDDVFILNKKHALGLLELNKKYDMKWRCFLRSDLAVKHGFDFLQKMRDSGLIEVFVGVESADNQIKENIHKGTTIEQDAKVLAWCKMLGIRCKMSFILGLPGESMTSMRKTRKWILEHQPDIVQIDRMIPFPGTPLTKHPEKYDLKYETVPDAKWFFCGKGGSGKSFVSTSHLLADEISLFLSAFTKELHKEGLSTYDH